MGRRGCAVTGSCLLAAFIGMDMRLRQGEAARSFDAAEQDGGTTVSVGASFGMALVGGPLLALCRRGRLPTPFGWAGVGVMACGLALRASAMHALGSHYTRTLRTGTDQVIVTEGPYHFVRHPGYAATLAIWLGYGLALTSVPATCATALPNVAAYLRRINAEEIMLVNSFGENYGAYQRRTRRLVPAVY